jgi:hypothetical protein
MRRWFPACFALTALAGCLADSASKRESPKTERERDSTIGASRLPGAQGVRGALRATDSATSRRDREDSLGPPVDLPARAITVPLPWGVSMIQSARHPDLENQSLYGGITAWASHARHAVLAALAVTGLIGAGAVLLIDWHRLPLALFLTTGTTIGVWGLVEQRAHVPHSTAITLSQRVLVVAGTIAAALGGFGLLFWVMGPAPVL